MKITESVIDRRSNKEMIGKSLGASRITIT